MGSSILQIGISGLNASRYGLETTSHNISNSNTDGYSRQEIVQGTALPTYTGAGFLGQGTTVDNVRRVYSGFLNLQVQQAQTQSAYYSSYLAQISQVDNLLSDASAGLSPALNDFFAGMQDVAAHPSDISSRQSLLSSAQAISSRFQLLNVPLENLRQSTNAQLQSTVATLNTYATQIVDINQKIAALTNSGSATLLPNDLLDQRDTLIKNLNQEVRATTVAVDDGTLNVFLGNGQALVVGVQNFPVVAVQDPEDPANLSIGLNNGGGVVKFRASDLQSGGRLAGLLDFRENSLYPAMDSLGRVAINLASAFNLQHTAGRDLNGAVGGNFFQVATPVALSNQNNTGSGVMSASITDATALTGDNYRIVYDGTNYLVTNQTTNATQTFASLPQTVDGVQMSIAGAPNASDTFLVQPTRLGAHDIAPLISDVKKIAAAAPNIATAVGGGNTGTGAVSSSTIDIPAAAGFDYSTPIQISFTTATAYQIRTGSPGFATVATTGVLGGSGVISYNGWNVTLTGTPAAADTFTVSFSASGTGDNRNAVALGDLQTTQMVGGAASLQEAYGQLVSSIGNKTREVQVSGRAQDNLLAQTVAAQQSVSGVNLDEEASNLIRYQQAYSASSRVISMANDLFKELIAATSG